MLTDALVLIVLGFLVVASTFFPAVRSRQADRLGRLAGARAADRRAAEARAARRARAVGAGVALAGLVLLGVAVAWPAGSEPPSGGLVVVSLAASFAAGALAVVEILRPGVAGAGPRTARVRTPTATDYLAPRSRVLCWLFTATGMVALLATLAATRSTWFDAAVVWRSPVPFLLGALPVVAVLSEAAVHRVLRAPQPARDESELYWQDAVRASTLTWLTVPPALVGLLSLTVCSAVLDDAASSAAVASGQVGPDWTLWLLVGGYVLPVAVVVAAVVATGRNGRDETDRFRARLWAGRPTDGEVLA